MKLQRKIKYTIRIIVAFSLIQLGGCANKDPEYLSRWYAEHYPQKSGMESRQTRRVEIPDSVANSPVPSESQTTLNDMNSMTVALNSEKNGEAVIPIVKGQLVESKEYNYSNGDDVAKPENINEYNVSSMIEGKLFKLVEDAYFRRDELEFVRLYNFFVESFPLSGRKAILDEKWRSFFYSEDLEVSGLKGSLVELTYPKANSLSELNVYFRKLKEKGVMSIQIEVVKLDEKPVYLFGNPSKKEGYYFRTNKGPVVDDLLSNLVDTARNNGLKVYASLPLRHYPRLGHLPDLLMDSSWNTLQNRLKPNYKLDLLNPETRVFLLDIVNSLLEYQIDGIVFKDDFTYETVEGFSEAAQHQYAANAGKSIDFNQVFVPLKNGPKNDFGVLAESAFYDVAIWRTREIKQLLWDLTNSIRQRNRDLDIGVEITSEMIMDEPASVMWYSTGLRFLKDLDVDFFILKWRKNNSAAESDFDTYEKAAVALHDAIKGSTKLMLKVPLSDETNNVIQLNRRIEFNTKIQEEIDRTKLAIGPVTRIQRFDFIN